jgi:hypothetical protein
MAGQKLRYVMHRVLGMRQDKGPMRQR